MENKDYTKGFDEGYQTGREFYLNDIKKEIFDITIAIKVLEKYAVDEYDLVTQLEDIKGVLVVLKDKVTSEFKRMKEKTK